MKKLINGLKNQKNKCKKVWGNNQKIVLMNGKKFKLKN